MHDDDTTAAGLAPHPASRQTPGSDAPYRYTVVNDPEEPWDDDDPPGYYVTAVTADGQCVGSARFVRSRNGERVVLTGDIWVEPDHRRRGVATGMMHHLRETAGKPVGPNGFTPAGLALWRSLGWRSDFTTVATR